MWLFKKRNQDTRRGATLRHPDSDAYQPAPFSEDITNPIVLRHHALRALCGAMTSVHSLCRSPHPFCGADDAAKAGNVINLIAIATHQVHEHTGSPLMAIYLIRAESNGTGQDYYPWPMNYIASLEPLEKVPYRKMVIVPSREGGYIAGYGQIENPVELNYATGSLDPATTRLLYFNPPPTHIEQELAGLALGDDGEWPRIYCFMHENVWHVMTMGLDDSQSLFYHFGPMDVVDDPNHNFGIHRTNPGDVIPTPYDGTEFSQVIIENCPRII